MATLSDHQIKFHAERFDLIKPFEISQLNPASYDVRLGRTLKTEGRNSYGERWFSYHLEHRPYIMEPGEFLLAHINELVRIPEDMECIFQLKSSLARDGLEHCLAGYIDPGYFGSPTLELVNVNRYHSIKLSAGMLIGQLRFCRLEAPCETPYGVNGHYQGDTSVQEARINGCVI